jgi:hypothetical protein
VCVLRKPSVKTEGFRLKLIRNKYLKSIIFYKKALNESIQGFLLKIIVYQPFASTES